MKKIVIAGFVLIVLIVAGLLIVQSSTKPESTKLKSEAVVSAASPASTDNMVDVSVQPRIELISILFRLAGHQAYNSCRVPSYNKDIKEHFGDYKSHAAPRFGAEQTRTRGVGYDAPMSLAIHLKNELPLQELVPLNPQPESLDKRWTPQTSREFIRLANQFAEDTDFEGFYKAHQPLYNQAVKRMQAMLAKEVDMEWFDSFFGERPRAKYHIVLGMANGGHCYGPHVTIGNEEHLYCILGVWQCDREGIPTFDRSMTDTIVHEFTHSYSNPLVDAHLDELEPAGKRLFADVQDQMSRQAYGQWEIMMRESLVRACGVRYVAATEGDEAAQIFARENADRGFKWTLELAELLAEYEADRKTYPTLDDFFPNIVTFFNGYQL